MPPDPHRGFKHMSPVEVKVRIRTGEMSEDAIREWWRIARELVPTPPELAPEAPVPGAAWECPRCHCLFERPGFAHEPCGVVGPVPESETGPAAMRRFMHDHPLTPPEVTP
jgi:hypothetical protein